MRARRTYISRWLILKWMLPLAIGIPAAFVADWSISKVAWLSELETLATQYSLLAAPPPHPSPNIVVIRATEDTPRKLGLDEFAIPRNTHARLLNALREAGAKVVLMDVVFRDQRQSDATLIDAIANAAPMKLTLATIPSSKVQVDPANWDYTFSEIAARPKPVQGVQLAHAEALTPSGVVFGASVLETDLKTHVVYPHVAMSATMQFLDLNIAEAVLDHDSQVLSFGDHKWFLQGNDDVAVQWLATPTPFMTFEYADALATLATKEGSNAFRGKLVIVGVAFKGQDTVVSSRFGEVNGLDFVAHLTNTILVSDRSSPRWLALIAFWVWTISLAVLVAWCAVWLPAFEAVLITIGVVAAAYFAPLLSAAKWGMTLETVAPITAVLLAVSVSGILKMRLAPPPDVRSAGQISEATVMFIDLRDSTGLTHRLGGAEYGRLYAEINNAAKEAIEKNGGHIERGTGDGVLAVFHGTNHAVKCARSAFPILDFIAKKGYVASAGLESGMVSGGYVWEGGRRTWSTSGDAINLAARLQSGAEEFEAGVAAGPVAAASLRAELKVESLGFKTLKGFDEPVEAFRVTIVPREDEGG